MQTKPECIICSLKQVLTTAGKVTGDPFIQKELLDQAMTYLSAVHLEEISPAEIATDLFQLTCRGLKQNDPFRAEMDDYNQQSLALYPKLQQILAASPDPVYQAILMAVAGNLIDLGIIATVDVTETIHSVLRSGLKLDDYPKLKAALARAHDLLYIADNAGEIVFDRVLLEEVKKRYPQIIVTVAVKSGPASNDALRCDAMAAGIEQVGEIIEIGAACLGIPRERCAPEFRSRFAAADVVIAKGHANFETIIADRPEVYVLLRAKCEIVASMLGVAVHDSVLKKLS